ncbi:MAG: alginate lyase family protein [Pirellulales bacterium]
MYLDQSVAMKGPQELFDVQRTIELEEGKPIGQTFVTGPEAAELVRIRMFLAAGPDWKKGEGAEMVVWDSPAKKFSFGRYTIWYEYRGFQQNQAEFEVQAVVKPNTAYYFEVSYVGHGDGRLGKVGAMKGADAYKPGQGWLAGKQADFDLCFQTHCKRAPNREGNLRKTFARFDLTRPGLAEVKKAVDAGDFETAIARTVAYFEARREPTAIIEPGNVPAYDPTFDTTKADLALRNEFDASDSGKGYAGPDLNWRADVSFDAEGHKLASSFDLNRFGPRGTLSTAYLRTGNEKYAKKLNDYLVDWYLDNPPPPESHIGGSPWEPVWASLNTGIRLGHGFVAYSRLHASPNFTTDCRFAYILSLADHADTLVMVGEGAGGNWSFTQNSSLLRFALDFPEFARAPLWVETACKRLDVSIKRDWLPDGVEMESAPSYQRMAYEPLAGILELIGQRGVKTPFTETLRGLLERQAEYFMYLAMPNGVTPFLGDWGHDPQREALLLDSKRYGRRDMRYVATAGKEGEKPAELSKLYPAAGMAMLRSDWGDAGAPFEDARYLMLHGLHFGAHGHGDINGVVVYAYGSELLCDPGSYIYGSPEHAFLNTAASHNLLTIDGEDQNRGGRVEITHWATTPVADYLATRADVYRSGSYRREVFYLRGNGDAGASDYWLVRDTAEGSGSHSLEQRWHVSVDHRVTVSPAGAIAQAASDDKGSLALVQVTPARLELEETTANTWEPRGVAVTPRKLPTLIYKAKTDLPAAIDTALVPFRGKAGPPARLEVLETSPDGLDASFKMVQGTIEDTFVFRAAGQKTSAAGTILLDGDRAVVRRVAGKLRAVLVVNVKTLVIDGRQIVKSEQPIPWLVAAFDASGMQTFCKQVASAAAPSGLPQ